MKDEGGRFLDRYLGCEVEVIYLTDNSTYRDRGRLASFGDGWIELDRAGETFLVPETAVRLVKVLDRPDGPGSRLLRPVEESAEQIEARKP